MRTLFVGASQVALPSLNEGLAPVTVLADAAILTDDGRIVAVEPAAVLQGASVDRRVDLGGRAVIPGLVDSHTHVVFAGARIDEMARRARGESYEDIARAGGGIAYSVQQLQGATLQQLTNDAEARLRIMLSRGTTTVEIKSGYGLSAATELKQLATVAALQARVPMHLQPTVLAHIVPKAYAQRRADYVTLFCRDVIAVAAQQKLARHLDVFVEAGAFTPAETRQLATVAQTHGLTIKLHVDQLRDGDGAALAAELHALSADHLEYASDSGRRALAAAGVVATVLPGCALFLGKGPWPNGRALRDAGCEVAVATDCNPGSSMIFDLLLCATVAATRGGLTLDEALWGATRGGAKALGLLDRGTLSPGERADFVILNDRDWRAALYTPGSPPIHQVMIGGVTAYTAT